MDKFIPKQDAKILELSGAINTSTAQGNNTPLKVGDTLRENVVYSASVGTTFLLQYSDGTTVTQDEVASLPETEDPQNLATIDPSVDAEIAALQAKVLSGEDPTLNLPDTAAGESAPTGNEGGGFIAVGRTGDETIAAAGHDTEGFTQVELPRVEEEQNFLSQLNLPSIISRSVTLYEQHLEQGTSPQSALLSQAESVSVIVQAGIQSLTINGLQVFADGNFVGPVTIITQFGTLTISSYDISTSTLSYSYTLSSNFDHSATDTLSEIFVLELTDSQGASVTSVVTANVVDDAPNGLDDSNQIAEGDIDGVNGNVLQNDTLGADSGSLTQITNSDNISVDVTGSTVISGIYGTLTIAADGSYTYQLNNQLPEIQALAIGEQLIEFFDYQLSDSDGDSIVQTLTITITGENDAPEVTSSLEDAMGTVIEAGVLVGGNTETAGIPQVSGTLTANDVDNGAVLTWQLTSDPMTPYGVFSIDQVTGEWTFSLDNELANSLAFGETTTEIFTITVTDQFGLFDTQEITITIVGTNDIPELTVTNSGSVTEDSIDLQPDRLVATGDITTFDVDNNDVLTLSASYNSDINWLNGAMAVLTAQQISDIIDGFSLDNDDMGWTYNIDNDLVNFLAEGDTITFSFDVTVTDANGAFTTQTVTMTINGTNDAPVITPSPDDEAGEVIEAGVQPGGNTAEPGVMMVQGDLDATDPDSGDTQTWSFAPQASVYGTFSINPATGEWTYTLNDSTDNNSPVNQLALGDTVTETYTVTVTDSNGDTDTQDVVITITGTNDIPELTVTNSGSVTEDSIDLQPDRLVATGDITTFDVDNNDVLTLSASYNSDINWLNGAMAVLTAQQISDIIDGFSLDNDDMGWTYNIDNDLVNFLAEGDTITFSFDVTVTDANGAFTTQTVTMTINGTNDAPVITPSPDDEAGEVIEAGVQPGGNTAEPGVMMVQGDLDATDPDSGDTQTWSFVPQASVYGTFSINPATGEWTYTLNDSTDNNSPVNQLALGDTVTETYTVTVTDSNGDTDTQDVVITITGTNDIPELTVTNSGSVTEDSIDLQPDRLVATGDITTFDVDNNDVLTLSASYNSDINWLNGAMAVLTAQQISDIIDGFSLDNDDMGWTYNIDNDLVNFLAEGDTITFSFDVTVTDANGAFTTQTVTMTINGTNDAPVITPSPDDEAGEMIEAGVQPGGNTAEPGVMMVQGDLDATDPDSGDTQTWSFAPQASVYGTFSINPATGEWTYTLNDSTDNNSPVNQLAFGDTVTETYTVTVTDSNGDTDTQDVVITITGTNDIPELTVTNSGSVTEDSIDLQPDRLVATGDITTFDVDNNDVLTLSASYNSDINWLNGAMAVLTAQQDRKSVV